MVGDRELQSGGRKHTPTRTSNGSRTLAAYEVQQRFDEMKTSYDERSRAMSTSPTSEMQIWCQVIKKRLVGSVSRKQALGDLRPDFVDDSSSRTSVHYSYDAHPCSSVPETQKIREDLMTENAKTGEMMQQMMMEMMKDNTKMQEMMQAQIASLTSKVGVVMQRKSKSANTESDSSDADASEFRI